MFRKIWLRVFYNKDVFDFLNTINIDFNNAFFYFGPPYIYRHSDYFTKWTKVENDKLINYIVKNNLKFIYSNWYESPWRKNEEIEQLINKFKIKKLQHSYNVGANEKNCNSIVECLIFA